MSAPASSTSSVEARSARRSIVTGFTDQDSMAGNIVRFVPVSAKTSKVILMPMNIALPEDYRSALHQKCMTDADATAGVVTVALARGKGKSWTFESPTLRLNAETFQPTGLLDAILTERLISEQCLIYPVMVVRMAGLGTAAQSGVEAAALLNSTDPAFGASRLVESKFAEVVALAGKEWFEDGVESELSRALSTLLH